VLCFGSTTYFLENEFLPLKGQISKTVQADVSGTSDTALKSAVDIKKATIPSMNEIIISLRSYSLGFIWVYEKSTKESSFLSSTRYIYINVATTKHKARML
jgi:hypothetical protein